MQAYMPLQIVTIRRRLKGFTARANKATSSRRMASRPQPSRAGEDHVSLSYLEKDAI